MIGIGFGGGVASKKRDGCHLREAHLFVVADPETGPGVPGGVAGKVVFTTLIIEPLRWGPAEEASSVAAKRIIVDRRQEGAAPWILSRKRPPGCWTRGGPSF